MLSAPTKAKKLERRFFFTLRGQRLSGIVWIDRGGEMIVKPLVGKARKHLSLFASEGKLYRHVTHEEFEVGQKRRYTQKAAISVETLGNRIFWALAPPDDPPPRITSFADKMQMATLTEWFARIGPRLFRKKTNSPVHVIQGPLRALLDKAFTAQNPENFSLDLEPFARYASEGAEEDTYGTIRESDLHLHGHPVAFSEDWSRLIFPIAKDMVFELDVDRWEKAVEENLRDIGFEGFYRALRRRGYSFIDEPTADSLGEALPP